jgi:hypothetical protein
MKVLICIDDTDNHESKGTGEMALRIANEIANRGWGAVSAISRHQLYVHRDIPYTSHNSAMCFGADILPEHLEPAIDLVQWLLSSESAEGSDPGFCLVVIDRLTSPECLKQFGQIAKKRILTKKEAYDTAKSLGVYLSEHGGTGGGVIGALAGAGLRLGGNDGRIKGKYFINRCGEVMTVGEIIKETNIDEVRVQYGQLLSDNEGVALGEKVKSVLLENKIVLLVEKNEPGKKAQWMTLSREKVRQY